MKKLFAVLVNATLLSSVTSLSAYEITPMSEEEFLAYKSQHSCSCDEHVVFSHTNILPAANESAELEVAQVASEEEEGEEIAVVEEQEEDAQVASEEEEIFPVASEEQEEAAPVAQEEVAQSIPVEKKVKSVTTSIDSNVSVGQETVFSINQAEGVAKGSHEVRSSTSSSFVLSK